MDTLTIRGRAQLDRIMSWGEHPTQTTLPAWALAALERGPDDDCACCGAPLDKTGVCLIGCEPLQEVG